MQRRSFLKLLLPLGALLAGCRPSGTVDCLSHSADWLQQLRKFADPVLGKAATQTLSGNLQAPQNVCAGDFAERYRQQAAADFAVGRVVSLDGWWVSETEAITHRAAYLASVPPVVG